MSFLLEDDQQATLEVALAFIDACDETSEATTTNRSNSSPGSCTTSETQGTDNDELSESPLSFDIFVATTEQNDDRVTVTKKDQRQQHPSDANKPEPKARSKARSNADAVSRLRARKKAEAAYLRDQVIELEAKLARLQTARLASNPLYALLQHNDKDESALGDDKNERYLAIKPKTVSIWLEIAAMQAKERYKSEALNVKLKDAIEKQMRTNKFLEGILGRKSNLQGLDLLCDDQQQLLFNDSLLTKENLLLEELHEDIFHTMYPMVESIFDHTWTQAADSLSCSSQMKEDPMLGSVFELRTNTPLRCEFHEAGQMVWRQTLNSSSVMYTAKYYMKRRNVTNASFQKSYTVIVDGPVGPVELHGISYVQKFDEPHRFLYMWTSRIISSNNGLAFRERGWMVASKSNVSAKHSAVFQTCYRVSCDPHRGTSRQHDTHTEELSERVLQGLTSRTRDYHQSIQNMLTNEFAGYQIRRPFAVTAS